MEYVSIPLRNRDGEVIAHTLVSQEDYEGVCKFKWHINIKTISKKSYVSTKRDKKNVLLHHFIIGHPDDGMVVDHINGDGLDNRRSNLRHVSKKQNSQNRNVVISNKTSKYLGVAKIKNSKKYEVACGSHNLGRHEDEIKAAKRYDICAYLVYGEGAKTNNLISFNEATTQFKLEDILVKPKQRQHKDLPAGLYIRKTTKSDKYYAYIHSRKHSIKLMSSYFECKEDAMKELNGFRNKIQELDKLEFQEHCQRDITLSNQGLAVINLNNNKHIIVDADKWHDLSLKKWWINAHGYLIGTILGVETLMHVYLYKTFVGDIPPNHIIDHINNVRHDNRLCNLRINTLSGNAHNSRKTNNSTSKYYGVYWNSNRNNWLACISQNYKQYNLGLYKKEIDAAKAYNVKAIELYGELANLNDIHSE
jgi:hypothetical protein